MYRIALQELKAWKDKNDRLPLILLGARQVGKTWLLKEFGKTCFEDICYINFEESKNLRGIFEGQLSTQRIIEYLSSFHGKKIESQKTLIIFDEVQECPNALTSLKYFAENAREIAICCAGSLLGVTLHEGTSFPVGKVEFLKIEPLSFKEFLLANNEDMLLQTLEKNFMESQPEFLKDRLSDYLKNYFIVGGMPRAVQHWIDNRDFNAVGEVQSEILESYRNDFSKHAPKSLVPKIHHVWDSIPSQLAKENKKFIYGVAKEGARAREYEDALLWLRDSGIIRKISLVSGGRLPLKAYEDLKAFKIYHLDVGLLRTMCEIDPAIIIDNERIFAEFNGSLTEQFVLQELSVQKIAHSIYYWSEGSTSEVDFIFSHKNMIVPLEAKAGLNVHAQSLKVFRNKYTPKVSVRTSLRDIKLDDGLLNLPLYELFNLTRILDTI
ncbi:MAG: AAA family ATPase [Treponema sp.]|nr:AAA family ATPase [Treponema sp.]